LVRVYPVWLQQEKAATSSNSMVTVQAQALPNASVCDAGWAARAQGFKSLL
jgi:hypothetical protein